jgi:PKD repeat protein
MKIKLLVLLVLVFTGTYCWSTNFDQQFAHKKQTLNYMASDSKEDQTNNRLFSVLPYNAGIGVKSDIKNAVFLEINFNELAKITKDRSSLLSLTIPDSENSELTFDLHDAKILTDNFSVVTGKNEKVNYTPGLYYQGTVSGISPSLAAWSIFDNTIMAVYSYNNENYVLGLWKDKSNINNSIYILYKDSDVLYGREFKCGVDDLQKQLSNNNGNGDQLQSNQCIKIYFECDYQMFLDQGGAVNTANYVTGLFNVVQLLFNNEVINTEISEIYVWSATDPYIAGVTSNDLLNSFQATRTVFNGNVAHFLTTRNLNAGGLAYLDIICTPNNAYAMSNIDNTYSAYPNFSWTVEVITHELGHNFGSNHTHWCGWTGGAIDDCYAVEGSCSPGPTPTNGGTIMSYCHLTSSGIALTNGFGTQPGNAIRAAYAAASCLTACASPPSAEFTANPIEYCTAPATVTFTDHTLGYTASWAWDIDNDGTIDYNTQSPTHTYTSTGVYSVKLIATNANGSNTILKTNYVIIGTVVPGVTIAITSGSNSICEFTPVTFTATPINGGAVPTYQWYLNGVAVAGEIYTTYTSSLFANGDVITCEMTSTALCPSPATGMSTGITMTVTPLVIPDISISITSGSGTICAGTPVSFSAIGVNGGSNPAYQWKINNVNVGTNSTSFSSSSLANGDLVTCMLTSNAVCADPPSITSNIIPILVNAIGSPTVSIAITSGTNPSCSADPMTFTATSTNGGTSPVYQWKKNGVNTVIGTTYTPTLPANGDIITCTVTSNGPCLSANTATSAGTTISLISSPIPGVSIAVTAGTNPSCSGSSITFTATPSNATNPAYQWFLNGTPITGAQNQTYTSVAAINGDVITCQVSSTVACTETTTSTGTTIVVPAEATVNFISDIEVCGENIAPTIFSSTPLGADYTWTNSNTSIGLAASGTDGLPAYTAVNGTGSPVTATITVTPAINGCPGTPSSYSITVNPTPAITQSGMILTSSSASSYQWYRNGQLIAGAVNQTYNANQVGSYRVIVNGGGCPSNTINVGTTGITQLDNDCFFTVYPNPNDGNFFVSFDVAEKDTYVVKMISVLGALVYQESLTDFNGSYSKQMNLNDIAKGVYLISLSTTHSELVKKIVLY